MINLENLVTTQTIPYIEALVVFIALLVFIKIFTSTVIHRVKKLSESTKTDLDDKMVSLIESIPKFTYFTVALFVAQSRVSLPDSIKKMVYIGFITIMTIQAAAIIVNFLEIVIKAILYKSARDESRNHTAFSGLSLIIKIVVWSAALVLILSNTGFDVSALVASMGIGGIAIALAVQNVLGDVLSSFSIYFDKPFEVGDFVTIGSHSGTIEKIGLKTTRLKTLQGEELVISNAEITSARIQNFKKMKKRRVSFSLGLTYDTTSKQLKKIPAILEKIIDRQDLADFDRAHFASFGDFSLNYDIVYYVNSKDYAQYMDIQQDINLKIKEAFEKEKIDMAFPTQTVYVAK